MSMNVVTPTIETPHLADPRGQIMVADDIVDPRYPAGCDLVFMRPGSLEPVVSFHVPKGSMVAIIPPAAAEQLRPVIEAGKRQQQAMAAQLAQARGSALRPVR